MHRLVLPLFLVSALLAQERDIRVIRARKQIALLVGNNSYRNQPLGNAANDARDVGARLRQLGYDAQVILDADRRQLARAVETFVGKLGSGDVGFFYYAGHGVQVEGENYLIPIDFDGKDEIDVRSDAYAMSKVQERMERSGADLNIIVLDACRNNPFRATSRSGITGLAAINAGVGTFVAFAAAPGKVAKEDPTGRNGLFTQYFLEALARPGFGLNEVFDYTRERVFVASQKTQLPWTQSGVVGRYMFVAGPAAPSPAPPPVPARIEPTGPKPGDVKVNPKDGQRYVWIPPGKFTMGCSPGDNECEDDEKPAHEVQITKGFWLGQTAVTVAAWKRYVRATGKPMPDEPKFLDRPLNPGWGDEQQPIVKVNWTDFDAFCRWAGGRLPTEAEWEYAARAGSRDSRSGNLDAIAWYLNNSGEQKLDLSQIPSSSDGSNYIKRLNENGNGLHPVALKEPNAWKLYDMLGNVGQVVSDWYADKYYGHGENVDPTGPPGGQYRARRGGSWYTIPSLMRVSNRSKGGPDFRSSGIGCRCAWELR
jgi:formylglycine-generating enzyme required for sulfatase activity